MLSSKFNILSHNSVTRGQIWKIPPQAGIIFSRWSFWVLSTLCYLQNWMYCPITLFQVVRIAKISFTNRCHFFQMIILSTKTLCYLQNWMFCPIIMFQLVRFQKFLHKQGLFFPDNCFEYNNHMLSWKLNVLSINCVPNCQIWKLPSQTGVVICDDCCEYQQPNIILKTEHFTPYFCLSQYYLVCVYISHICYLSSAILIALTDNLELTVFM